MSHSPQCPPELLAPAGDWDCAQAAIAYGADAIYFGLDVGFNARARATNFHLEDLPRLMQLLHRNAMRGFVTLNTLAFTDELAELEKNVRHIADAGVDAVIVQDIGVVRMIRRIAPTLAIHGSTQMTITSAETLAGLADLDLQRIVLARELSIKEIQDITSQSSVPVEVFVHGALCVAYSGQCLTSESLGGRSANRGQCAQACRLNYELVVDGVTRDLGDNKYLLSPLDLAAYNHVPQLIEAGVASFKIEGRLKSPEYVANIVSHYRQAIDAAMDNRSEKMTQETQFEMELSFSRGFAPGWLEGCDHKRLVPGLSSNKRGVPVGTVSRVIGERINVDLQHGLKKGDGIVIAGDRASGQEIGGRIYQIYQDRRRCDDRVAGRVQIELQAGVVPRDVDLAGRTVFLSHSPEHSKKWQTRSIAQNAPGKRPLDLSVHAVAGEPLKVSVRQADIEFELVSEQTLEVARKHAIAPEQLEQQFARLGGTPFYLREIAADISGQPMVPLSLLGELRKQMLQRLEQDVDFQVSHQCDPSIVWKRMVQIATPEDSTNDSGDKSPQLHVLCRALPQIEQVLKHGVKDIYAEFHDIREYGEAVKVAHEAQAKITLAPLRIQKPGEMGLMKALLKRGADAWLVRNLATLQFAHENNVAMIGDFSLNVTNPITAGWYLSKGLRRITASYDLNRDQLTDLVQWLPVENVEVVIHQHMPMFHMEHCVFCTVLSPGTNKSNCGRPCDRHLVHLRDRVGTEHFLDADVGCRNTLYNGRAQSGAEAVPGLLQRGIRHFRIELLPTATQSEIEKLISLYRQLIEGKLAASSVWQQLRADNRIGVTRGTLEQKRNPLAIL